STSALVQDALGTGGGVFDLNSGCSGFVYGLVAANGIVATGLERVLLVASDTVSRIVDPADRGTAILFGDGAGAVMLQAATDDGMLLGWDLGADGSAAPLLYRMDGGYVVMDGKEVFRKAVRVTVASAQAALENAKVDEREIALFIPHQANVRIIEAVNKRLGISMDKTVVNVDTAGNTSSASIPLALAEAANQGRLQEGDLVLMAGFGAGMTWASAVVRWGRS
ncbi:MAG: beta-ketoacyl-ACP synthase 3, partial [Acidimicrobiales bacterium]